MRTWLLELYLGDDCWDWVPLPCDLLELIWVMAGLFKSGRRSSSFMLYHTPAFSRVSKTNDGRWHAIAERRRS